jgi:hypothetical protein
MAKSSYTQFLRSKEFLNSAKGIQPGELNASLFPFQRDIVRWALRKGRAAIFSDCGTGKSAMQLEWAQHIPGDVLILAPLAVSKQTQLEGVKFGIPVTVCESQDDVQPGINITNYEKLHKFNPDHFTGIVLDESSILKSFTGKIRNQIIEAFSQTPYRLACTATPAPNDFMELGNHAEFLGVMSRIEMLATFFVHDGGDTSEWRLKGHAEDKFWQWVCGWAAMLTRPSDLGYSDEGFTLPGLSVSHVSIPLIGEDLSATGLLFAKDAVTLQEQRAVRRASKSTRVCRCAEIATSNDEPWLIWCELNDEGDALEKAIPGAVQVKGADTNEHKAQAMLDFAAGKIRVLISKPSICGFGMNFQVCNNVAFVGVSHSYEQTYQAIRRCWRFGQTKPVNVYMVFVETESLIVSNLQRKEDEAQRMRDAMLVHMKAIQEPEIHGQKRQRESFTSIAKVQVPSFIGRAA